MPVPPEETPSTDGDDDFSDTDTDTADHYDSYHPIPFHSEPESDPEPFHILSNGHQNPNPSPNSFSVDLNGEGQEKDESELEPEMEEEEEEEEGNEREAFILRAFEEDESRRRPPLQPETASRIMDAMRGVSFLGSAPDWAARVPEDQWVDRLRSLRGDETAPGATREEHVIEEILQNLLTI